MHADEVVRLAHAAGGQHLDDVVDVTAVGRVAGGERALVVLVEADDRACRGPRGMRKAHHFVGVHWQPRTRIVAFGPVSALVTLADGSERDVRAPSARVWTDLELPDHPERVVLQCSTSPSDRSRCRPNTSSPESGASDGPAVLDAASSAAAPSVQVAGVDRCIAGLQQRKVMTEKERRILAYHEAGHAVMSHLTQQPAAGAQGDDRLARPGSGLHAQSAEREEHYLHTAEDDLLKVYLRGPCGRAGWFASDDT